MNLNKTLYRLFNGTLIMTNPCAKICAFVMSVALLSLIMVHSPGAQIIVPEGELKLAGKPSAISLSVPVLKYETVSWAEMDKWPVDRKKSGEKLWAETTWGGDTPEARKLFNWNVWPDRVVFRVSSDSDVARGEVYWRRSALSIRQKGLKIVSMKSGELIEDARLVEYNGDKAIVDFRPVSGSGIYYLYYGASEDVLFNPSSDWLKKADSVKPAVAKPEKIEARCDLDSFWPMETVPLKSETGKFLKEFSEASYLVFPQDRDNSIKLQFEMPVSWITRDPGAKFVINADRNEYRVFQLGIMACGKGLDDIKVDFGSLKGSGGSIESKLFQCLTLTSNIKSIYIKKPSGPYPVPKSEIRTLWIGLNLPENVKPGKYTGEITLIPSNAPKSIVPVTINISEKIAVDKGDNDLWRLSRLRWLESDIGLSNEVFPPFKPLVFDSKTRTVTTWGHKLILNSFGLPEKINFGDNEILSEPVNLSIGGQDVWSNPELKFTESSPARISWTGKTSYGDAVMTVKGSIEFDGCIDISLKVNSPGSASLKDMQLSLGWVKENAVLAAGMGYRGKRDRDGFWHSAPRAARCFDPSLWMGSMKAGLGWITWDTTPWEDSSRMDAATVKEKPGSVKLELNLGAHTVTTEKPWQMEFALRPTPVKPVDLRHWQFRYLHRGGGFSPAKDDTPQSYLADNCKRLDELVQLGVKRLNLHDWWGPAFNYPQQWEGPDNLSRLTAEAHKRGIRVKVYNSGRELSNLAPEFWGLVYIGTEYKFIDKINPEQKGIFQDAWHENHLPDGLPQGWPRVHAPGNEHAVPVSNATRNGNFYLESIRYMTENFGTDGAYWDGADGPTLGHREMAKRLWTIFRKTNPEAAIDAHHGTTLLESPMTSCMLCLPFIDSVWHGEGFAYDKFDPWAWLVEISGLPFGIPSEMLSGEQYIDRGMLFGIWPRMGWGAGTEKQQKLWACFDKFGIDKSEMLGFWEKNNGVTIDRPDVYITTYKHPVNGVLIAIASWHPPLQNWVGDAIDVSLGLDRKLLGLPDGVLKATDIYSGGDIDILKPVKLSMPKDDKKSAFYEYRSLDQSFEGRLIWVRGN